MFIVDMFMFLSLTVRVSSIIIHLVKFKCWSWVAFHEHVTAGGLVWNVKHFQNKIQIIFKFPTFHGSIFLLDLNNPGWSGLSDGLQRDGGLVQSPLPLGLLVPGRVLAAAPPLGGEIELEVSWQGGVPGQGQGQVCHSALRVVVFVCTARYSEVRSWCSVHWINCYQIIRQHWE